jgi:hypothetical protein
LKFVTKINANLRTHSEPPVPSVVKPPGHSVQIVLGGILANPTLHGPQEPSGWSSSPATVHGSAIYEVWPIYKFYKIHAHRDLFQLIKRSTNITKKFGLLDVKFPKI